MSHALRCNGTLAKVGERAFFISWLSLRQSQSVAKFSE
jgi:hypothetical protein